MYDSGQDLNPIFLPYLIQQSKNNTQLTEREVQMGEYW
jgi:hypothetical protein